MLLVVSINTVHYASFKAGNFAMDSVGFKSVLFYAISTSSKVAQGNLRVEVEEGWDGMK